MESDEDEEEWTKPVDESVKHTVIPYDQNKTESHTRVILHIDIDCFYAQVEMLRNPELRNKPLGIQQKYIIVTCNYVARERGLTKLMTIKDAREKCPDLVLVCGEDLTNYRQMSYKISNYLQKYCPLVERLGFDENFLDITELVNDRKKVRNVCTETEVKGHVYMSEGHTEGSCDCGCQERLAVGSHIAAEIRAGLLKELGITSCGGIAHNKLLSKLVAGTHKPNQQTTLFPDKVNMLMSSLKSVRSIQGIGHTTARRLKELGVITVEDLQNAETSVLEEEFGHISVETMKKLCIGVDDSPVIAFGLPQTLSDEDSFKRCGDIEDAKSKIRQLINSLLQRLLEDGRRPQTLRLSIRRMLETNRYNNRESRQCNIHASVFNKFSADNITVTSSQLESLAYGLFTKMVDIKSPFHLTLINVAFAKLEQKSSNDISHFFSPKRSTNLSDMSQPGTSKEVCESSGTVRRNIPFETETSPSLFVLSVDNNSNSPRLGNMKLQSVKNVSGIQKWFVKQPVENAECKGDISSVRRSAGPEDCRKVADKHDVPESLQTSMSLKRTSSDISCTEIKQNLTKRKRVADASAGKTNLPSNLAELLPSDLDINVFLELPPHIQKDVLDNAVMYGSSKKLKLSEQGEIVGSNLSKQKICPGIPDACMSATEADEVDNITDRITNTPQRINNTGKAIAGTSGPDNKAEHVPPVEEGSKTCLTSTGNRKEGGSVTVKQTECLFGINIENRQEQNKDSSCILSSDHSGDGNSDTVAVPDGIDQAVFSSLPPEIKDELTRQWKNEKANKKNSGKSSGPDKHYFKSPKPAASNNITDYFSKKT